MVLADLTKLEEIVGPHSSQISFVFVDDGSTDDTVKQLQASHRNNLTILTHETNKGPGAAFETAFRQALAKDLNDDDVVVTLEGDATSDPKILKRLLLRLQENDDVIMVSPYLYGGGLQKVQIHRVLISHIANGLIKIFLNLRGLSTFSCFFRMYRGRALKRLDQAYPQGIVTCHGFDCAVEILIKAVRVNLTISEIPFQVDWSRRKGKSKMKIMRTAFNYLVLMFRFNIFWGKH